MSDRVAYIIREGRYSNRGDQVRLVEKMNMPEWAQADPREYWRVLDAEKHIRRNARLMFQIEAAIPRDLPVAQQNKLVHDFVRHVARLSTGRRGRHAMPVVYAIHEGVHHDDAVTGRWPNPHFHLKISTSINDGIARAPNRWFRRANGSEPGKGGAPRSALIGTRKWLLHVRRAWARFANAALRRAGLPATMDHRSNLARGLLAVPTMHLGPLEAARERAGRPGLKAQRNAHIRSHNKALEESIVQRRAQAMRIEAARKERAASELALRAKFALAKAELRERLETHPLAATNEDLLSHVSILLLSKKLAQRASNGAEGIIGIVPVVRVALGEGWLCSKLLGRVWWTRADCNDLVVMGAGFIATDAGRTGVGSALGRVAGALGLDDLIGCAAVGADDLKEELDVTLADRKMVCSWRRQPKPKSHMRRNA
jgi:hypothetical protein